jgi:hypothetical protein
VGWWDKVKAATSEVTTVAKEVTDAIASEVEQEFGDQDWYQEVKDTGQAITEFSKEALQDAATSVGGALEDFGKTADGKMVGEKSKQLAGFLSKLPVLSLATDIMRTKNGVDDLYEHLKAEPTDPQRHLWLAEALDRMNQDQRRYTAIRSTVDPSYLVARHAIKTSTELGEEPIESPRLRLLRNAFSLALGQLKENPADRDAIHVVARVYLAQGHLGEATRFAKLAVLADPKDGLALVTLSRVYLAQEQFENANRASHLAIERNATTGHEVIADLVLKSEAGDASTRIERYSAILDQVSQTDRERYWGPSVEGINMVEAVGAAQVKKATDLLDRWW